MTPDEFENRHAGADIYVLGSGPTLEHIPPAFWRGKLVVTTNHGGTRYLEDDPPYMVTKYHHHAAAYAEEHPGSVIVVTRYNTGNHNEARLEDGPYVILDHPHNTCEKWTPEEWPKPGEFLATYSSITTAMHWAAHLGAANIILAGHDCGWIDGTGRVPGYRAASNGGDASDTDSVFWAAFNGQSVLVKEELSARYGCTITSVNPWINLHLEGHTFRGAT